MVIFRIKVILVLLFFSISNSLLAQSFQDKLDEADKLRDTDPTKSNELLHEILKADSAQVPALIRARTLQLLGLSEMYGNQFVAAKDFFSRSYKLFTYISDDENAKRQKASLIFDIGRVMTWEADYDSALQNFIASRELYLEVDYSKGVATALNAIAIIYAQFNEDFDAALEVFKEATALHYKMADTLSAARTMQNIGQLYQMTGELDSALYYLRASNKQCKRFDDNRSLAIGSNMLGTVHYSLSRMDSSEYYFKYSSKLNLELNDSIGLNSDYYWLSKVFLKKQEFSSAEHYASIVYNNSHDVSRKSEVSEVLSEIYEYQKRNDKALSYYKSFKAYSDSIKNEFQQEKIGELQTKFETEKKEAEIERLSLQNEIQAADLKYSRTFSIAAILISIIIILAGGTIYYLRAKRLQADRLAQQSQMEALQKRYMELLHGPTQFKMEVNFEELNKRIVNPLTEREYEILELSLNGNTNQQVADALFVSLSTIKFHLGNVYNKFGVSNKKEALEYVVKSS